MTKKPSASEKLRGVIRISPYIVVVSGIILIRIISFLPPDAALSIADSLYKTYRKHFRRRYEG